MQGGWARLAGCSTHDRKVMLLLLGFGLPIIVVKRRSRRENYVQIDKRTGTQHYWSTDVTPS